MYVNGVLEGTASYVGALGTSTNSLRIGEQASCYFFSGIIDEVRVYNRALSAAEIQIAFQESPDFSSNLLAKVPKGTTQVFATFSWQGIGSLNATIVSPSQTYTEDTIPVYQKTSYSTSGGGTASMLNIKRLSISVSALSSDENWNITLAYDNVNAYQIAVEVQR
jgi:hypothetical protein